MEDWHFVLLAAGTMPATNGSDDVRFHIQGRAPFDYAAN